MALSVQIAVDLVDFIYEVAALRCEYLAVGMPCSRRRQDRHRPWWICRPRSGIWRIGTRTCCFRSNPPAHHGLHGHALSCSASRGHPSTRSQPLRRRKPPRGSALGWPLLSSSLALRQTPATAKPAAGRCLSIPVLFSRIGQLMLQLVADRLNEDEGGAHHDGPKAGESVTPSSDTTACVRHGAAGAGASNTSLRGGARSMCDPERPPYSLYSLHSLHHRTAAPPHRRANTHLFLVGWDPAA